MTVDEADQEMVKDCRDGRIKTGSLVPACIEHSVLIPPDIAQQSQGVCCSAPLTLTLVAIHLDTVAGAQRHQEDRGRK